MRRATMLAGDGSWPGKFVALMGRMGHSPRQKLVLHGVRVASLISDEEYLRKRQEILSDL